MLHEVEWPLASSQTHNHSIVSPMTQPLHKHLVVLTAYNSYPA